MKKKMNFYRIVLNMIFYVLYVLLVSIVFSFIFPTIMIALGEIPLEQNNPLFAKIQIAIIILVLVLTLILRKFLYLPIFSNIDNTQDKSIKSETNNEFENKSEYVKVENINTFDSNTNYIKEKVDNFPDLDIKIGKEIK